MSACNTFTEHVWKPGECKNCFKPKSLHRMPETASKKGPPEHAPVYHGHTSTGGRTNVNQHNHSPVASGASVNANIAGNTQRGGGSSRSGQFRPPVAKKPTIAVKPTMMLPCPGIGLDTEGNPHLLAEGAEPGKTSAFTVWNHNGLNRKRPAGPNNNEGDDEGGEIEGYASLCPPSSSNNNNGLTDVLKEIAGLGQGPSSSREDFFGRITCSYRRSLERALPAAGCLAMGSHSSSGGAKHVSLSDSAEVISSEGGRFCYPEFSSDGEDDDDGAEGSDEDEDDDDDDDDGEHESWDESDEELLAMEIRMRGQPRFANFRAATLSPVPFAVGKKWNTVPLRNRSLQRICAVDYDDSYDEILNGYPSVDSNGAPGLLSYGSDPQGSGFLSNTASTTSPESSSSLPEDSCTSSSGSSAPCGQRNGLHLVPVGRELAQHGDSAGRALSSPKATETHKAVLAIRLQEQDASQREGGALPQALPGQPITISFSPTEEQAKPYRVVSLEKTPICKPYTVVDVSASMATTTEERPSESTTTTKIKGPNPAFGPPPYPGASKNVPMSAGSPFSPKTPLSLKSPLSPKPAPVCPTSPISPFTPMSPSIPVSPSSAAGPTPPSKKPGNIRYQEVWTSSTSPRQKIPKVELPSGGPSGPSVPPRHSNHKSAPTSPVTGLSSSRTVPVKSPNLSEIKFNSYNNAGMPPFPIIIRDEPAYARSSKNAVKVPIVINPSAYDNLAVYKSFLGLSGELPQPKPGAGGRVTSHTYEEIGSSESTQPSPTEHMPSARKLASASTEEDRNATRTVDTPHDDKAKCMTNESNVAASNFSVTFSTPRVNATPTASPLSGSLTKSSSATASISRSRNPSGEPPAISSECQSSSVSGSGHREKASMVLSQIVAAIQPPQSPPESPSPQSKTCSAEELYALPPDATKGTLSRPKSLHCHADSGLSKSRKETPTKILPKSQSASAAEAPTSPKPETGAPYPPPRSTSSPYHATNLIQRHFNNWTRPTGSRPSDGEISPGAEGRRSADGNKPKRWISFKSFFRRRKDEDEQKEKAEREKEKGKLVGLDGTVITMLPPPPIQRQHWFSESKTDDPNQKPTIIFTYKPDSGAGGDGDGELRVEECNTSTAINFNQSGAPKSRASLLISKVMSQMPAEGSETEMPPATSLPAKLELSPVCEVSSPSTRPATRPLSPSEGSASLGEPEEDEGMRTHSHSPASSSCSATYTNLGQSRASMIPLKHPRHLKSSDDTLHSEPEGSDHGSKATPPPLPKKVVPRAHTEPSLSKEPAGQRSRGEAKPGGTSLSVANPLYDLDSTWETASQSSSLSSDARQLDESGDSLERPAGGRSLSCLTNSGSAQARERRAGERRGCRSTESLTARARSSGRGREGGSKPQRQALYKGIDSWEEVVGRIRSLHTETLCKLATRCEDRFMAGQKDHLRFGTDSWSHFRLTTGKPCCEAGDAVYYTAAYAKDPLVNYAVKICRYKVKETQQQFFHSLAVRQSLPVHFNIQQDCGHFLADVPARLLPWEEEEEDDEDGSDEEKEKKGEKKEKKSEGWKEERKGEQSEEELAADTRLRSRVVVITREVPFQTVADFVREGVGRHARNPELYERQVCLLLLQLCAGLEHMKPYHVTHCDLRLENLLLVHCQPGNPWNMDLLEPNNNNNGATASASSSACPARLIISNFSQAKQKNSMAEEPSVVLKDRSRLAPELLSATQYRKCDEFQTGILVYEMLHRPNPFEEAPGLKEREYARSDLPPLPARSLYSQGLQRLASMLLDANPSERIRMGDARACLQCLLWGPREDLFHTLGAGATPVQRQATLQNWLDLKRTLMMIKFAERSLDSGCGVSLEDWLCCQYLAFATTDTVDRVIRILQEPQAQLL